MQLLLSRSFSIPTVNLKPLLFVSLAGVTAVSVYSSLVLGESEGKAKLKDTLNKVIKPLLDLSKVAGEGLSKLYEQMSNWAKSIANQKDNFVSWFRDGNTFGQNMHDGTRLIFNKIKNWAETLIKDAPPVLWDLLRDPEKLREKIYYFTPFVWHAFSALSSSGTGGSFMFKFADVVGHKRFGDLARAVENNEHLAGKGAELMDAFRGDAERTLEALEKFKDNKEQLDNALKTLSLVGKIKDANKAAMALVTKAQTNGLTEQEKEEGKKLKKNMEELHRDLDDTIKKAKEELAKKKEQLRQKR